MKTGRNEPCSCGSGVKYKKCCLHKTQYQKLAEALISSEGSLRKEARVKQCLHPNKRECDEKIVRAHAIQNNRILSRIAVDGYVETMDGTSHLIFQGAQTKGRKTATVFTGFCRYHDKVLFQEIEDHDFVGSQEQVFLLTYRTMAWHYQKKQEQRNAHSILHNKMLKHGFDVSSSEDFRLLERGLDLGVQDNENEKLIFDKYLLDRTYDKVNHCIWRLPYEIQFAVSMMCELEHDIYGLPINNLEIDASLKKLYLNVFPAESTSFCIWSWLENNDNVYLEFSRQFMELSVVDRKNYLSNNLPRWTDSIIISPRLWRAWGNGIQQALIAHANFDFLYRAMEEEKQDYRYAYMETPWDFFEEI